MRTGMTKITQIPIVVQQVIKKENAEGKDLFIAIENMSKEIEILTKEYEELEHTKDAYLMKLHIYRKDQAYLKRMYSQLKADMKKLDELQTKKKIKRKVITEQGDEGETKEIHGVTE